MLLHIFSRRDYADYVRNFIFGVEDSLVSTVGLLSGIAVAHASIKTIITTGTVLIAVEALSMGIGSYLSEQSVAEYRSQRNWREPAIAGTIMMFSYLLAGLIPLSPYIALTGNQAFWGSIASSLISLLILGFLSARLLNGKVWRNSLRMLAFGGLAILIGTAVGSLAK